MITPCLQRRACRKRTPRTNSWLFYRAMSSPAPGPSCASPPGATPTPTLLLYSQVVGKIRLALAPKTNQWWNVTLYVTARGLTTSPMPYGDRLLQISFDFIDHRADLRTATATSASLPLARAPSASSTPS